MADTIMAPRLSEVTGVGHVSVQGGIRPAIRIQADLSRLAAYGIALEDLRTAIVGANVAGAKGSLDGAHQSYTIAANDQITAADAYKSVVVAFRNGAPVHDQRRRRRGRRAGEHQGRRLLPGHAGDRGRRAAPARRQCDRDRAARARRTAAAAARDAGRRHASPSSTTAPPPSAPRSTTCSSR